MTKSFPHACSPSASAPPRLAWRGEPSRHSQGCCARTGRRAGSTPRRGCRAGGDERCEPGLAPGCNRNVAVDSGGGGGSGYVGGVTAGETFPAAGSTAANIEDADYQDGIGGGGGAEGGPGLVVIRTVP
jgi:hypothetical protein